MIDQPRVTVGLPVVGGTQEVEWAIRSVFAQTEQNWELLIVCDGAPKALVDRVLRIKDPRVTVHAFPDNRGLPERLNFISKIARSQNIARMDSDDAMHPLRLALQLDFMDQNRDVDVLGSSSYLIDEKNEVLGHYKEPPLPARPSGFLQSGVFSHPTVMFRKEWALENPYDPARVRTEDKELWLRAARRSHYEKMQESLLFCRVPVKLSIQKQKLTAKYDRRLIRDLGRTVASGSEVYSRLAKSVLKQNVFRVAGTVGQLERLHRSKYRALSQSELSTAKSSLAVAITSPVPGWDHQ